MASIANTTYFGKASNITNITDSSCNSTSSSSSNEVSSGSAAFIAIALLLGCLSQIPGSLITTTCNRFWRISPLSSLAEGLIIFFRIGPPIFNSTCTYIRQRLPESNSWYLDGFERQGNSRVRAHAYAILAERIGNSRKHDFWLKQQRLEAAPTLEQVGELLDDVAELEDGSTLRPVVIVPMLLQFAKLCIIKGGFMEVKALAFLYFWSWFWVELLLLIVHGKKLGERDLLDAERILLLSVARTEVKNPTTRRKKHVSPVAPASNDTDIELQNNGGSESSTGATQSTTNEIAAAATQTKSEEVRAQTEALLTRAVGAGNVPRNRITFRGGRAKLSTMQGTASNWMYQQIVGNMADIFDTWLSSFFLLSALEDYLNIWVYILFMLAIGTMIPVYLIDLCIGAGLAKIAILTTGKEDQSILAWKRDWGACRALLVIFLYFIFAYSPEHTSKPEWLDWLG